MNLLRFLIENMSNAWEPSFSEIIVIYLMTCLIEMGIILLTIDIFDLFKEEKNRILDYLMLQVLIVVANAVTLLLGLGLYGW